MSYNSQLHQETQVPSEHTQKKKEKNTYLGLPDAGVCLIIMKSIQLFDIEINFYKSTNVEMPLNAEFLLKIVYLWNTFNKAH